MKVSDLGIDMQTAKGYLSNQNHIETEGSNLSKNWGANICMFYFKTDVLI